LNLEKPEKEAKSRDPASRTNQHNYGAVEGKLF